MKKQTIKLKDLVNISSGLVVKRREAIGGAISENAYRMLTLKSFEQSGTLMVDELETFYSDAPLEDKYLTQKNDVIIRLSNPNTAIRIKNDQQGFLIPSLFVLLRLKSNRILPDYLSLFLNSEQVKRLYKKYSIGATIQIIKTSMIKEIEIEIKSIEEQQRIIEFSCLMKKESMLLKQLLEEKTKYYDSILNKMIQ